jgi:hypothetical protein
MQIMISSLSVTPKRTLMIPNNLMYGLNLEKLILNKIVYEVDCSDIPH